MLLLHNTNRNPHFNIALEEYLLRNKQEEVIMLWWSEPSVIIGKHQNAFAEVNLPFVMERNIPVIRRLSGGGTVFHAPGNLNFTFILEGEPGNMVDFKKHMAPVIAFLQSLGVDARFAGKNDIRAGELKISGNAEHVYKNRVLHHGTLLFDTDLDQLREAIRVHPGRYRDKSVQSVRSAVANISGLLEDAPSFTRFAALLEEHLAGYFAPVKPYSLTKADICMVQKLVDEKYNTWEWNYAWSPSRYHFEGHLMLNGHMTRLTMEVLKGEIISAHFTGEGLSPEWRACLDALSGIRHAPGEILRLLREHRVVDRQQQTFPPELLPLFF